MHTLTRSQNREKKRERDSGEDRETHREGSDDSVLISQSLGQGFLDENCLVLNDGAMQNLSNP
jgi:hypothetical protein